MQDRPLHVGMEVHFRFVDGDDEGQITPALFVDDDIVFQRHGTADGHHIDLGDDTQGCQGNELHIVCPGPVHAAEHAGQEEDVDEIRRVHAADGDFVVDEGLSFLRQAVPMRFAPLRELLFQGAVNARRHALFFRHGRRIGHVAQAADEL